MNSNGQKNESRYCIEGHMLAPKSDYGFANDKTLGLGKIRTGLGRVVVPID